MCRFIVQHSWEFKDCTVHNPGTETLSYIIASPLVKIQCIFFHLLQLTVQYFSLCQVPITMAGQWQHGMRSLPNISTFDKQSDSNTLSLMFLRINLKPTYGEVCACMTKYTTIKSKTCMHTKLNNLSLQIY